ncbi:TBC1 domain family member 31 [Zophobas morio]|uniref:TBC1 domain family member 31 n=1 Tax=Zophobas morio TaxID=2755281 RepID=UPI003083C9E6
MNLNLSKQSRIYKKLFDLKPPQRNGLILNLHHTEQNSQKIRFINSSFHKSGQFLVLADNEGNIFVIDFSSHKFWNLPRILNSCTIIKFSHFKENEILVGAHTGRISVVDIQTGFLSAELVGHECPVSYVSFASDFLCLTSSINEAILWNLETNTKIQVLNLTHSCTLKYVSFIPVTNDILTCFNDDCIQIWQFGTFEVKNNIPPLVWFNHEVKNITFTLDGKIMVLGCRPHHLALFLLSTFKLLKFITLPEYVQTLKHVDFVPQPNDGGSNKLVAVLSGRGSVHFYDFEQNIIVSELVADYEISKYDFSSKSNFFVCLLCSGDVNIYDVVHYIVVPVKLRAVRAETPGRSVRLKKCLEKMGVVKEKIREILEIEKLRMILKECGEYPDSYRKKIWEHLLELPNNKRQYNAIINNRMIISFDGLCQKYPLQDKRCLKNLKQLLDNLVTWCPFFFHVDYLPLFVFPFVKVFANKPLTCFEAVCTIIINWCQFWFEYFPLPPINILAMVENVLMEHDPELLDHLTKKNITAEIYAWPILKTTFSEILAAPSWRVFWDHVLTNEPSFLLCGVVAYNILHRAVLFSLKDEKQFRCFYNTHHPVDVKRLLAKSYQILANTSASIHPRQYLNMFQKIKMGEYPNFCDYPKTIVDMKAAKSREMTEEAGKLKRDEVDLFRQRLVSLDRLQDFGVQEEENRRILEMENAIRKQLLEEQDRVQTHYERIAKLREQFNAEDKVVASLKNKIAKEEQKKSRQKYLNSLLNDVSFQKKEKDYELTKVEDELLRNYSQLLKNKYKIEKLLPDGTSTSTTPASTIDKHQQDLANEIRTVSSFDKPQTYLKDLNLTTGLEAMDNLIKKIEDELEKEKRGVVDESAANRRVLELQVETRELAAEVNNLIKLLAESRSVELNE